MEKMLEITSKMDPKQALAEISKVLGVLLSSLDDEDRTGFFLALLDESQADKVSSMVHL